MQYIPTIGLEVHAQLKTASKIFCSCTTKFGSEPNTQICPVCLGMPGVLPVFNRKVVELAIKAALAVNCAISPFSVFARKNYFYPDLPKGYQISQFEQPLAENGYIDVKVNGSLKSIRIRRIHLEEDAGKSIHPEERDGGNESRLDVNRCGVPLIEIVTEPDIGSPAEAYEYLTVIKKILQYLDVSDCNMEEGSLRCDANVSVRPPDSGELGVKTELKNLNSFRFVEKAVAYEINRQVKALENGDQIRLETYGWNATNNTNYLMRTKEESDDYRYFPEPDLVPLKVSREEVNDIKKSLPELPRAKKDRFIKQYGISEENASVLTSTRYLARYYEDTVKAGADYKKAANWILSETLSVLKEKQLLISDLKTGPDDLSGLLKLIDSNVISGKIAKSVFIEMTESGEKAEEIVKRKGLVQISDPESIKKVIDNALNANPNEVNAYISGKDKLIGFFIGRVMKETGGKVNPGMVNKIIKEKLDDLRKNNA